MDKHKLFIFFWSCAVIVIFISMASPWWQNVEERKEDVYTERYESRWSLTSVKITVESDVWPDEQWTSSYNTDEFDFPNVAEVWLRTFLFVFLALILNFALLWVYFRYKNEKTTREWVISITAFTAVVTLLIPIFVAFSLPLAINSQQNAFYHDEPESVYTTFYGEKETEEVPGIIEMKYKWGPQYGWFLSWLAFGFDLLLLILIFPKPKSVDADVTPKPKPDRSA